MGRRVTFSRRQFLQGATAAGVGGLVVGGVGGYLAGNAGSGGTTTSKGGSTEPILIGSASPVTGPFAGDGQQMVRGHTLAVEEINGLLPFSFAFAAGAMLALVVAGCGNKADSGGGGGSAAASWPQRDLRIMAPADPGGGWDTTARVMGQTLTQSRNVTIGAPESAVASGRQRVSESCFGDEAGSRAENGPGLGESNVRQHTNNRKCVRVCDRYARARSAPCAAPW